MAYQSDWVEGTVSVTNGSTAVTGVGTVWNGAGLSEGDTLIINNLVGVISTVNNALSITLAQPWQGASATNVAYRARYMSDGARYTAVAKQVLQDLQAGNVSALAGLTGAANKIPMFTGPGAMSLLDAGTTGKAVLAAGTQDAAATAGGFVRSDGGVNMTTQLVRTGWASAGDGVLVQVASTQLGYMWTDNYVATNPAARRTALGAFSSGGGTIAGNTNVTGSLFASVTVGAQFVASNTASGVEGNISLSTAFSNRWLISKTNEAETGSNLGANFGIGRWSDGGAYLGTPLFIQRNTGIVTLNETPYMQCNSGPDYVATNGQQYGPANFGFDANRGGFTIGGNVGGRSAVHFPVGGRYRITWVTAGSAVTAPGATMEFLINGSAVSAHVAFSTSFNVYTNVFMVGVAANSYITIRPTGANMNISGWNSRMTAEFIMF